MKFPDFIIPGFDKCGTSALILNLGQHPEIQVYKTRTTIESIFWDPRLEKTEENIKTFKQRFDGKICGEKASRLFQFNPQIQSLYELVPNIKILFCLRNPVHRLISHFEMEKRWHRIEHNSLIGDISSRSNISFLDKLCRPTKYIQTLNTLFLNRFPKENITFFVVEWAKKDFNKEISKIYNFLGAHPYKTEIEHHILKKEQGQKTGNYFDLFQDNSNYHIWKSEYYTNTPIESIKKMYEIFKPYNEKLFEFLGYEIKEWTNEYGQ